MPVKKTFLLRLDPALFEQLQALAAQELRSVNSQIEYLLAAAIRERGLKARDPESTAERAQEPEA